MNIAGDAHPFLFDDALFMQACELFPYALMNEVPADPEGARDDHRRGPHPGPNRDSHVVVGWAIVDVKSKDEAIELSRRFWQIVGDGQGTIQRIFDPGETPQAEGSPS